MFTLMNLSRFQSPWLELAGQRRIQRPTLEQMRSSARVEWTIAGVPGVVPARCSLAHDGFRKRGVGVARIADHICNEDNLCPIEMARRISAARIATGAFYCQAVVETD